MTLQRHDNALIVYANLDHALRRVASLETEEIDVRAAHAHLGRALQALYRAFSKGADWEAFGSHCEESVVACRDALTVLQSVTSDDESLAHLQATVARCLGILSSEFLEPPPPSAVDIPEEGVSPGDTGPPATWEEPALISLHRPALLPAVVLSEKELPALEAIVIPESVEPDDATLDELHARTEAMLQSLYGAPSPAPSGARSAERGRAPTVGELEGAFYGEQLTEDALLRRRAEDFFDDLSMMGVMRISEEGDTWTEARSVEQRLFARVDALVACGPAAWDVCLAVLEGDALEDPDHVWGALLLLGSVAGDDTLDQALRILAAVDLSDDAMRERVSDAWTYLPHPRAEAELTRWLCGSDPERVLVALRALGRRRSLPLDSALALAAERVDLRVAREAILALALGPVRIGAHHLSPLLARSEPPVVDAALEAALAHCHSEGVERARDLIARDEAEGTRAPLWLALGGELSDLGALLGHAARTRSPVALEALGWFGHLDAVEPLIELLRAKVGDAVLGLQRLTAANLTDDKPSRADDEAPPFTTWLAPRFEPLPTLDADLWLAWWRRHGARADRSSRQRFGCPCTTETLLWELAEGWTSPLARRSVALELSARAGCRVPIDPRDFVVRQLRLLDSIAPIVRARRWPDGRWVAGGYA